MCEETRTHGFEVAVGWATTLPTISTRLAALRGDQRFFLRRWDLVVGVVVLSSLTGELGVRCFYCPYLPSIMKPDNFGKTVIVCRILSFIQSDI